MRLVIGNSKDRLFKTLLQNTSMMTDSNLIISICNFKGHVGLYVNGFHDVRLSYVLKNKLSVRLIL